jgi:ribonucleoside-diphosphate reductase alpha chain
VKYKKLVGGGLMKIVNQTVPLALKKLGYIDEQIEHIIAFIDKNDTIEGAPHMKEEHLTVFDCAFKAAKGQRTIQYMGHVKMMAAVQPYISGAISKTVKAAMYSDSHGTYIRGITWDSSDRVYRDGCKRTQPRTSRDLHRHKTKSSAGVCRR